MTEETTLQDFGANPVSEPLVKRRRIIRSPHTGKIAGFIGREKSRKSRPIVYTTLRRGYHYYQLGGGWAISDSILAELSKIDCARIIVHDGTESGDTVWEYATSAYLQNGKEVHPDDLYDEDDPQTYTPEQNYLHKWENHAADLFCDPFDRAVKRISKRRGD